MNLLTNKLIRHLKSKQKLPLYLVPDIEQPKLLEVKSPSLLSKTVKLLKKVWINYVEANKIFIKAHELAEHHHWNR